MLYLTVLVVSAFSVRCCTLLNCDSLKGLHVDLFVCFVWYLCVAPTFPWMEKQQQQQQQNNNNNQQQQHLAWLDLGRPQTKHKHYKKEKKSKRFVDNRLKSIRQVHVFWAGHAHDFLLANVGECCKAQWVCVHQRIALTKVIYYDDDDEDDDIPICRQPFKKSQTVACLLSGATAALKVAVWPVFLLLLQMLGTIIGAMWDGEPRTTTSTFTQLLSC